MPSIPLAYQALITRCTAVVLAFVGENVRIPLQLLVCLEAYVRGFRFLLENVDGGYDDRCALGFVFSRQEAVS
jgi:hypothetical protein